MVPTALMTLEAIPLTPNGKVNKKALQALAVEFVATAEYVAPRNSLETTLVGIWQEVLGVEPVGIHDNFFDLGGHSLLATQLVSRIRRDLNVELPLKALFETPTVAGLTTVFHRYQPADQETLIQVLEDRTAIPLSFGQERLWFLEQYEGGSNTYHMPGLLRLDGDLDRDALERTLVTLVERHEALRTIFVVDDQSHKPTPYQEIVGAENFVLHQTTIADHDLPHQVASVLTQPFDLSQDLPFRVHLLHVSDQQHYLLLNMHHIVSDGWSMGIITKEFDILYRAYSGQENNPLVPLAIQYADYAAWQREYLSGERLGAKLDYWKKQLAGVELLDLPTTYPRPAEQSYRGKNLNFSLNRSVSEGLQQLSQRHQVTLFMTLLGAFGLTNESLQWSRGHCHWYPYCQS
jgi:Acyl carrier protein